MTGQGKLLNEKDEEKDNEEEEEEEEDEQVPPPKPGAISHEAADKLALAQYQDVNRSGFPTAKVLQTMIAFAGHCVNTGQMPRTIDTTAKAVMVFQAGRELGIPPIEALNSFYFVNNHLTLYGPIVMRRIRRFAKIEYGECNDETATVTITRKDDKTSLSSTITMAGLKARGVVGTKDTFVKHPKTMLIYKAVGEIVRHIVPEAVGSMGVEGDFDTPEYTVIEDEDVQAPTEGRRGKSKPAQLEVGKKKNASLTEALAENQDGDEALRNMSTLQVSRRYTVEQLRDKLGKMGVEIPDKATKGQLAALITANLK